MSTPIRVLELRSVRGIGGGPEKTILLGAARTDPRRFQITVCYLRDRRDDAFTIDREARRLGVDYVEVLERHSFDRGILPALRALVRERRIDIVHAHEYKTDLLAALLARTDPVTPLSTVHGWSGVTVRERWCYYPADRWLLRRFPRVIAVSGAIRRRLLHAGVAADRISVVLNAIDSGAFSARPAARARTRAAFGLPADSVVLGSVGRLEHEKRFDLLVDAAARLQSNGRSVGVVIAGTGSLERALADHAAGQGVRCVLLGHRADIADVAAGFDVFVQASDTEGTPNCVLEAMALEVPVVATDVGGTRDLVDHGTHALLVGRRDTTALAGAIEQTLDDQPATAARVRAARHRVETVLSFDARMRAVEDIYEALMARRPGPLPAGERAVRLHA